MKSVLLKQVKKLMPDIAIRLWRSISHYDYLDPFRHYYFISRKTILKKNDYISFLLGAMYDAYYKPKIGHEVLEKFMFKIDSKDEYIKCWYDILTIDSADIIHLIMDATNLSLPGHQSANNIEQYYKLTQQLFVIRYLQYPLLTKHYLDVVSQPYSIAFEKLSPIKFCELGPGIPHGLFYLRFRQNEIANAIESIELIDYDLIYRDITYSLVKYFFPNTEIVIGNSNSKKLQKIKTKPNFLHAKDVFEHLHYPEAFLEVLLNSMSQKSMLAVDIHDRQPEAYQHVVLTLSNLRDLIRKYGFDYYGETSRVTIFYRM